MNCMKCGRENGDDQAFCEYCLIEMEHHPVKPGTVILLPTQEPAAPKKPARKKKPLLTPEEQVPGLKKRLWALRITALLLTVLYASPPTLPTKPFPSWIFSGCWGRTTTPSNPLMLPTRAIQKPLPPKQNDCFT